jgi:RNA polymerase sigma-70 factor (ECF subfamily)
VCAIARHKLADHYRRLDREERRRLRLLTRAGRTESDPELPESRDARDAVHRALGSLPAMQRAVLVFHYLDELSVLEIAAAIGRSESAVESLLSRGREGFKRVYREPSMSGDRDG